MKRIGLIVMAILSMALPLFSQAVDIPDPAFLTSLIDQGVDRDGNKLISYEEAELVSSLDLTRKGDELVLSQKQTGKRGSIINLKGIEAFIHLVSLDCSFHMMRNPDFSNNRMLEYLDISFCGLSELDVSRCSALRVLNCSFNKLTSLDLSANEALVELDCFHNWIEELNISNSPLLEYLDCGFNRIKDLDISKNRMLKSLSIDYLRDLETITGWSESFPPGGLVVCSFCTSGYCYDGPRDPDLPTQDSITGQEEILSEFVKIYPNPVTDRLTIEWPRWSEGVIELTSANGQLIYLGKASGNSIQVDLSSYPQGIYYMTLRTADVVATEKVMKQ